MEVLETQSYSNMVNRWGSSPSPPAMMSKKKIGEKLSTSLDSLAFIGPFNFSVLNSVNK